MCIVLFVLQTAVPVTTDVLVLSQDSFMQPWRFVSSIFIHGSLIHLVSNLFALILFGFILEKVIGSRKMTIVFFVSGIVANLIAVNFYNSSLGASGAIYGIMGCLNILRPKMVVWAYSLPMPMFLAAIVWVVVGIFGVFMPSNTGHIAHLSGIAVGVLFGIYYYKTYRQEPEHKIRLHVPDSYMNEWEDVHMR